MRVALTEEDGDMAHGDVTGAYIKAPHGGRRAFARIRARHRPDWWKQAFYDPVVEAWSALYGEESAGADWQLYRDEQLKKIGWRKIKPSVFTNDLLREL